MGVDCIMSQQMASPGGGDDIHGKMSKKIAQLTKVIYQLNTKNEDAESKLKHLTLKHASELDAAQCDTVNRTELDELSVKFDRIKDELAQSNSRLNDERLAKTSHVKNIQMLKSEIDIEQSLREKIQLEYSAAKNSWQLEQQSLLSERNTDERKRAELERLEAARRAQNMAEKSVQEATTQMEQMRAAHSMQLKSAGDEYNDKIDKLKGLHEREMRLVREELDLQTGNNADLKKQSTRAEEYLDQLRKDCEVLKKELRESKRTTGERRKENSNLSTIFNELNAELELQRTQLAAAATERSTIESKLNYTLTRLDTGNKQLEEARSVNIEQITKIATLEGEVTRMSHELSETRCTLNSTRDELSTSNAASSQSASQTSSQIQTLTIELRNETEKRHIDNERSASTILQLETDLKNAKKRRENELDNARQKSEALDRYYKQLAEESRRTLQAEFDAERETIEAFATKSLEKEKTKAKVELDKCQKLHAAELAKLEADLDREKHQCSELRTLLDSQGNQTTQIAEKVEFYARREKELEARISQLDVKLATSVDDNAASLLKLQLEKEARHEDQTVAAARLEQKVRETQHAERAKWEGELGRQLELLRRELSERLTKERQDALGELHRQKQAEISAAKKAWQEALNTASEQVAQAKADVDRVLREKSNELNQLRSRMTTAEGSKEQGMAMLKLEHEKQKSLLRAELTEEKRTLEERLNAEKGSAIDELDQRYRDESMKMMESQRISITALKSKLEQNQERQIKQLDQEHQDALELLQMRLEENHQVELDEVTKRHEQEILEIEAQLVDERMRLKQIESNLDDEIDQLKIGLQSRLDDYERLKQLKAESDASAETLKAKVHSQAKNFESVLTEKQSEINLSRAVYEAEKQTLVNELEADGLRKQQQMLLEFNQAQELLKTKIHEIAAERDELDEKYRNRESRPEDLEKIKHIGFMLNERERQMAKLEEDMRYYQLELVNREQNYNAMFSSNPQVGLLNPLQPSSSSSSLSKKTSKNQQQPTINRQQARFSDTFVKIEPSLYVEHQPNNRLE